MITTIVVVFIIAVVVNLILGFVDISMKRDAMAMLDFIAYGEEQQAPQGTIQNPQVIALSQEQIQAIVQLVLKVMEQKK